MIQLVGSMLFDQWFSDDLRLAEMGMAIPSMTPMGLHDLRVEPLESGPVAPREERTAAVRTTRAGAAVSAAFDAPSISPGQVRRTPRG